MFGHVTRINDKRLPTSALYSHTEGAQSQGRQAKMWMENVIQDRNEQDMDMRMVRDTIRDKKKRYLYDST